jgi:2-C-methyl-D-erythritol 2,4-cyclodiphosphate synthase
MKRVRAAGWRVGNLDSTVVLERPKLGARKGEICERLAELLGTEAVNVKGKTHEGVDAVGRGEAIEAYAVVLLIG